MNKRKTDNPCHLHDSLAPEKHLFFYHPDHLGSSSWITYSDGKSIQHLHYLPFGESFVDQRISSFGSRYTFSAKEKDVETGYGYFGARYYSSDLSIWLSVDPMSDKYPTMSAYVYCANNPVKLVDPNGTSTRVADNGDGTYTVIGGDLTDKDRNIYVYTKDKDGNYTVKGESIGISTSTTSFYNDTKGEDGKELGWMGKIDTRDKSGDNFLGNMFQNTPTLLNYMKNAGKGDPYDFKVTNGTGMKFTDEKDFYRGMPIGGTGKGQIVYSSARDVGNIAAGYVAGVNGISWGAARMAFDCYQSLRQGIGVEGCSTRNAQYYGWHIGVNNTTSAQQAINLLKSLFKK